MAQNDDFWGDEESFSSILDLDRILDAIGRGELIPKTESFDSNDPLFAELVATREALHRDIPPAPDVSFLFPDEEPELADGTTGQNSRLLRTGAKAAAAGGVSLTSMLVAGGVAAALAVGGLGYAAYSNSQGAHVKHEESAERGSAEALDSSGVGEDVSGGQEGVLKEENVADKTDRDDKDREKDKKDRKEKDEADKSTVTESRAPLTTVEEIPTTTIILGGTESSMQPEPGLPVGPIAPTKPSEPVATPHPEKPTPTAKPTVSHPEPRPTLDGYSAPVDAPAPIEGS